MNSRRNRLHAFRFVWLFPFALAGVARAETPSLVIRSGDLAVAVDPEKGPVAQRAAQLFVRQARQRAGIEISMDGKGAHHKYVLRILRTAAPEGSAVQAADRSEGFRLVTRPNSSGELLLSSSTPSGVVAGIGHLMRLCQYSTGQLTIPAVEIQETSAMPVGGIYFASHFGNFYDAAPVEEVDPIIEDCALWGTNQLIVWFDMHHFKSFDDPAAQAHLHRLQHFAETAQSLGMKFGLVFLANEGYADSPKALRASYKPWWPHYHVEICPSNPEGLALIGREQARVLGAFPRVDVCWSWPYDQGGCACDRCMPWGGNGFLAATQQLGKIYRKGNAHGQFWISTWMFDRFTDAGRWDMNRNLGKGDFDGLFRLLDREAPEWLDGIILGTHGGFFPELLLTRPHPDRYPLTCFPEISMYGMYPWGGFGANPLPGHLGRSAGQLRGKIVGGWPYSEGIYEDFNKFLLSRFYWNPNQSAHLLARDYAAYYFGSDVAEDGARLFELLESTHARGGWKVRNLDEADAVFELATTMEKRMPAWAAESWRWRIVRLRTEIDHALKHGGLESEETRSILRRCTDQLRKIYHAEHAEPSVMPPTP